MHTRPVDTSDISHSDGGAHSSSVYSCPLPGHSCDVSRSDRSAIPALGTALLYLAAACPARLIGTSHVTPASDINSSHPASLSTIGCLPARRWNSQILERSNSSGR